MPFFLLKKTTQPRKNWSFVWKKLSFFTQKDLPASQKTEFFYEKKKCQKRYQKDHPDPQKLKFCMKKIVFFYSKNLPAPQKTEGFWKKIPTPNFTKLLNP